jgi:hypothetical protein
MKTIVMVCLSSILQGGRYVNTFRLLPLGTPWAPVETVMDCPAVPGKPYELRIAGSFPGYVNDQVCSSDMIEFRTPERLKGIDVIDKAGLIDLNTQRVKCLDELTV